MCSFAAVVENTLGVSTQLSSSAISSLLRKQAAEQCFIVSGVAFVPYSLREKKA